MPAKTHDSFDLTTPESRSRLPCRNEPYWHWLQYNRSLGLRKSGSGVSYWLARYKTLDGRYARRRLGPAEAGGSPEQDGSGNLSFGEAVQAARVLFARPEISQVSAAARPLGRNEEMLYCPYGPVYTVGHALADYLDWCRATAAQSHFRGVLSRINYYLLPALGILPVADLDIRTFRGFVLNFLNLPPSRGSRRPDMSAGFPGLDEDALIARKRTLNLVIGVLRNAIRIAWENGHIDDHRVWIRLRQVPNIRRARLLHLSRAECRALIAVCEPDLRLLVMAALYTGCRAKELTSIRTRDIARDGYGVYIRPVKRYVPRFVFLSDEGMAFFLDQTTNRADDDLVFRRDNGLAWHYAYQSRFKRAVLEAGLPPKFTFHGLRHTYASQLVQAGAPYGIVAEQLGHQGPETVMQTYGHFAPQIREAEVRQRFLTLDAEVADRARLKRHELAELLRQKHGLPWRGYASISLTGRWPRSNLAKGDPELAALLGSRPEGSR